MASVRDLIVPVTKGVMMSETVSRLHIMQQNGHALLDPVRLELARLENRLQNYLNRLDLDADDLNLLESARAAVTVAHHEVARLSAEARDE